MNTRDWRRGMRRIGTGVLGLSILAGIFHATTILAQAQTNGGYSLRFYGHGVDDIDRAKIPVESTAGSLPTDIGGADFTIEFWLRGVLAENRGAAVVCGQNEDWIDGSIVLDRDRFSEGRKFGLSVDSGGRVVFGVTDQNWEARTLCGVTNVLDNRWHHVAVQRRMNDGLLWVFVDGRLDATATGPAGDLSYPDGVAASYRGPEYCQGPAGAWGGYCRNEPFFVLGAEKHDAGASVGNPAAYPSFSGWLDELRLSNVLRYAEPFTPAGTPFIPDANTVGLYHFDEGPAGPCTGVLTDSATVSGAPTHGVCSYGGAGVAGPQYVQETPFGAIPATPAFTPTPLPAPPTATRVPATATRAPVTPTSLPVTATATLAPSQNNALIFDGIDDVVVLGRVEHGSVLTVEFWVRPASSSLDAIIVNQADDNHGWSFELNAGRPSFWVATNADWQVVRHATRLVGGRWYHVAGIYNDGSAQVFVNGRPGAMAALPSGVGAVGKLRFGGIPGYDRFVGALDDVRISQGVRYAAQFTPPVTLPAPDADTLGQWALNEGRGQTTADSSAAGNPGQLGLSPSPDAADPAWEAAGR
mgnify:CR=1 FL=1